MRRHCLNACAGLLQSPGVFLALVGAILSASTGCTNASQATANPQSASSPQAAQLKVDRSDTASLLPVIVDDRLGRRVRLEKHPARIVSLSPSTTELLFAIGAGSQIVAATRHCNYPSEASELPRIGGGTMESISYEKIVGSQPDLVLCKWDHHEPLLDTLDQFDVPAIALGPETMDELYEEIIVLGKVTGYAANAERLVADMKQRVESLTAQVRDIPAEKRRTVFYEVWDQPLMTAGPASFIGEILELAGTQNVFSEVPIRYPRISAEAVVARNPDVILAPSTHASEVTREAILNRQGWDQVNAVRNERVFVIDGDPVSRCGPRLIDALEEVIQVVYPERVVQ